MINGDPTVDPALEPVEPDVLDSVESHLPTEKLDRAATDHTDPPEPSDKASERVPGRR